MTKPINDTEKLQWILKLLNMDDYNQLSQVACSDGCCSNYSYADYDVRDQFDKIRTLIQGEFCIDENGDLVPIK